MLVRPLTKYPRVAVGLIHHPVHDRLKKIVATNVTNFDIHDIARVSKVYGVERYYIIHPMKEQLMFVERVLDHWRVGQGSKFNPKRKESLEPVRTAESIEAAMTDWCGDVKPLIITTSAKAHQVVPTVSFKELRGKIADGQPVLVLFGTGFGLSDEVLMKSSYVLESIRGRPPQDFRHLSVRSAVSIVLDRLLGVTDN